MFNSLKKSIFLNSSFFIFLLFSILFQSCGNEEKTPDVSHIKSDVKVIRFEEDLFKIDTNDIAGGVAQLKEKYGSFFDEVFMRIISDLRNPDATPEELVGAMVKNQAIRKLADTCALVFPDATFVEKELNQAFQYYQYYFPNAKVPEIYSYISEYSLGVFTYEDKYAGFGWDFFLGEDYLGYDPNYFPGYIKKNMRPEYIVPKFMEALATDKAGQLKGNRLIDHMIHNGKILYIKDLLLPHTPDSIVLEYTAAQTAWTKTNEFQTWAHFLEEELLYSVNYRKFQKLISPSPMAPPGMPQEAPGRVGNWIGMQIIKSYMKRFPETTLEQLCAIRDGQEILEKGKYKPKK